VNAAKREAQKGWSSWENAHMGPRWQELIKTVWPAWHAGKRAVAQLKRELAAAADPSQGVMPSLHALEAMGLLEGLKLTPLGIMATEVNEGHAVLMAQTYQRGLLSRLGPEEIIAVLMAFTEESGREMPSVNSLDVPPPVTDALWAIHRLGEENQRLERSVSAPRPPRDSYWELNTTWVEPVWRWLQGATVQELCADYDCYEGNLMRILAKGGNLLEEWRSLATLAADTEMLEKMRGLEAAITRGAGAADSLYLHL
jgi:superfamily II RNA helicase